jgi:hypothetical protein
MPKLVGYMEGTDPLWLTTLQLQEFNTVPLSNGIDGHGQNIRRISEQNKPDLIVCYLHKLIAPQEADFLPMDLLLPAKLYAIPVLVVCPEQYREAAVGLLGVAEMQLELVDPQQVLQRALELLK